MKFGFCVFCKVVYENFFNKISNALSWKISLNYFFAFSFVFVVFFKKKKYGLKCLHILISFFLQQMGTLIEAYSQTVFREGKTLED